MRLVVARDLNKAAFTSSPLQKRVKNIPHYVLIDSAGNAVSYLYALEFLALRAER